LISPTALWLCLKGLGLKPFLRWPPYTYIHNAHVDIIHTHRCIYVMNMHTWHIQMKHWKCWWSWWWWWWWWCSYDNVDIHIPS
jgi:hypothetical protein